jgi:peptide/nickel transport system substrate-binding protein
MFSKKLAIFVILMMIAPIVLAACGPTAEPEVIVETVVVEQTRVITEEGEEVTVVETVVVEVEKEVEKEVIVEVTPTPEPVTRTGAWVDTVVVVEEPDDDAAITRMEVGELDSYFFSVGDATIAQKVADSPELDFYRSFGSYNELTFNPAGPVFEGTGKLNPFAVAKIREAMNWLIDREYIAEEITEGMSVPKFTCFNTASADFALMAPVIRGLEAEYAYNMDLANETITAEMEALGATLEGGVWTYEGEPVEIIVLIRTEDERRDIGDYVANQLEAIGFTVTRDYRTAAEASPIWIGSDPNDGLFHIYTGGWITTVVPRNLADNFAFFYTDMGLPYPLWQNYVNDPEFYEVSERLMNSDFTTVEERTELMAQALGMAMEDGYRMFLTDASSITPVRQGLVAAADLYGGLQGSYLWPLTIRYEGQVGGSLNLGMPSILTEPWNPIAGTNWIYDMALVRATGELAIMPDPFTGLYWPQRLERAEVVIQEGLPVAKTLDWVDLSFEPEITVPDDAWADWDAAEQRFLTAAEVYTETQTVYRKSTVYYPEDLFDTVKWHDGSPLSMGDFVMGMILTFDRAKEDSAIYDEAYVPDFDSFMSAFRGVRVVSTDPLVIETYSNSYQLDAELNVSDWWPYYDYGQGAWHTMLLGVLADGAGEATFSSAKAEALEVDWMSYIAGPTVEILKAKLDEATAETLIPYAPTFGEYVTAEEATARYENLNEWFRRRSHLWIGTGPFYLERAFPVEGTVILQRNAEYPDMADKWLGFSEAMLADIDIDGPDQVSIGSEAAFDVYVTFQGDPYLMEDVNNVTYLLFDATGALAESGEATAVEDGLWEVVLSADTTGALEAGSNRLEVVVVSKRVALPASESITFVTQ